LPRITRIYTNGTLAWRQTKK